MGKRIITVDDSKTMREMVSFTLKNAGYDMLEAEDGKHALEVLTGQTVDVIITDLNMPKISGSDLIRKIMEADPTANIIVSTGHDRADPKVKEALDLGAKDLLGKPFGDPERLIETLSKVFHK